MIYESGRTKGGSPIYALTPTIGDSADARKVLAFMGDVSPTLLASAVSPGEYQVRCGHCGLTKPTHASKEDALEWFWSSHIKGGRIHG